VVSKVNKTFGQLKKKTIIKYELVSVNYSVNVFFINLTQYAQVKIKKQNKKNVYL